MNLRPVSNMTLICLLLLGCGGVKYGEVSGKITNKGAPLPGGTLTFWPQQAGGGPASSEIEQDGSYSVSVPIGEVSVTVETESVSGKETAWARRLGEKGKGGKPAQGGVPPEIAAQIKASMEKTGQFGEAPVKGNYVKINSKYSSPGNSGIKTSIHTGQQEFNIDLK